METGGFEDQGVETGRFRGEDGWVWRSGGRGLGIGVEMGGFRDQGVKTGRFRGGYGWVWRSGGGDRYI